MDFAQRVLATRRGTMIVAAAAALAAGVSILVYLNSYRSDVRAQGAPVTVLVASRTITKGTPGSAVAAMGMFARTTVRESQLRDGAFSDVASLRGKYATADVYKGQQLTAADFAASAKSMASTLSGADRVITVPLDASHGLIGNVQVGDHVDILAGFNIIPVGPNGVPIAGGQARAVSRLLFQNVPVVGLSVKTGGIGTAATSNVSLKLTDAQALQLAFTSDNGKIWLVLRPSSGTPAVGPGLVTVEDVLRGIPPVQLHLSSTPVRSGLTGLLGGH
jgi:Flp pilus assembly protein CpaB